MNLESLYQKIRQPETLDSADLPALKDLCAKYPYAQLFSVLYLKALAQSKDLHFEDELQQHAYKITDRAKLYELIHENSGSDQEITALPMEEDFNKESVQPQHEETAADEHPIIGETAQAQQLTPQPGENQESEAFEQTKHAVSQSAEDQEIPSEEEKPAAAGIREIDELDKEILSSVMATAYSLELEEKQHEDQQNKDVAKPESIPTPPDEDPKRDLNQSRSFTSWLKLASETTQDQPKAEKESDKIIEKFIREEPERFKPKTEFYSAPKKAKESISEGKLIYTETLANIYALQGNYPKAITAFQQLMLTIPEKKLYFAQKIEELNKKINS
ncbi:MAG: hypothetical protein K0R65_1181 [Crocinitomicaceae bacterium]|jgi:hypothetical protein|nr:hypothetical protein [Crocinitomicaceae bacterium]